MKGEDARSEVAMKNYPSFHAERARQIAAECLQCETADDSEELVRTRLGEEWPQLFPPETLPTAKEMDRI